MVSDTHSFPWDFRSYFRKEYCEAQNIAFKSKNDLALEMIAAFPAQEDELVYVLMDNWYTSEKVVNACNRKGFHVIAAVKTNRKICPAGIRIGMSDFLIADLPFLLYVCLFLANGSDFATVK